MLMDYEIASYEYQTCCQKSILFRIWIFREKKDGLYLFGHIRSSNAHGNSNISLLESRGIVDTIASDSDDVALFLETLHDHQLLLRRRTGKHDLGVGTDHLKFENLVIFTKFRSEMRKI